MVCRIHSRYLLGSDISPAAVAAADERRAAGGGGPGERGTGGGLLRLLARARLPSLPPLPCSRSDAVCHWEVHSERASECERPAGERRRKPGWFTTLAVYILYKNIYIVFALVGHIVRLRWTEDGVLVSLAALKGI